MSDLDVSRFVQEGDFEGHGKTFDEAAQDAWNKAREHEPSLPSGSWFKVKHHWVRMVNPVSEHKVVMGPGA